MKIIIRVLFIILIAFLLAGLGVEIFAGRILQKAIRNQLIYYGTDTVDIGSVDIHYFPLGLSLREARFDFRAPIDTALVRWKGYFGRAEVKGVNWWQVATGGDWEVDHIKIGEGAMQWIVTESKVPGSGRQEAGKTPGKVNILLKEVYIDDIYFGLQRDSFDIRLKTSIVLNELQLVRRDSLLWSLDNAILHSEQGRFENLVKDFDLGYRKLHFDSREGRLQIDHFKMHPRLSPQEYAAQSPYIRPCNTIDVKTVLLSGIDPTRINQGLFAQKLQLDSLSLRVYKDSRKEWSPPRKPLLSELMTRIPLPVNIDTLAITRGGLVLHEKKKDENPPGELTMQDLGILAYPFSNVGVIHAAPMILKTKFTLMDESEVNLTIELFDRPQHDFTVNGSMAPARMPAFNPILYPVSGIYIKSGHSKGAVLKMNGNDYVCSGNLNITYEGLKVAIPSTRQDREKGILGKTFEGLGNMVLINSNNKKGRQGDIYYDRDLSRPFLNYWWKAIETGLLDSMVRFYNARDEDKKRKE